MDELSAHETESEAAPLVRRLEDDEDAQSIDSNDVNNRNSSAGSEESRFLNGEIRRRLKRAVPRIDSLDVEAMQVDGMHDLDPKDHTLAVTLHLTFQAIGVLFGDVGTSPLYVYSSAFNKFEIEDPADILGALSVIIYTLTLIPFIKYAFIVLRVNNGEGDFNKGGTFSLYSLICRYAKVNLLPNRDPSDEQISNFKVLVPTKRLERAMSIKEKLEKHVLWKTALLLVVLLGTSLAMGDGILTPCLSVMSAVSGLKIAAPNIDQDLLVVISLVILILLFSLQRFGARKVGLLFSPVLSIWFAAIGIIGIYNITKHDPSSVRAFNPAYIYYFFKKNGFKAWYALGGLVLCITGGEAMFADLGHFSVKSIQIAFSCVVYPCLLLAYTGQAAYLMKHPADVNETFYKSIPAAFFWPMFVIATLAAIIASQAMISATFSVIKMAVAMDCFPRVKVIHTSKRLMGQIYVPVINWFLMIMCLILTFCFKTTSGIGNAYGVTVVGDMLVTTSFVALIMVMIWQTSLISALGFVLIIGAVELIYFAAVLLKVLEGGWVPLALAAVFITLMYIWHYGNRMKYQSELDQKISMDCMLELGSNLGTVRVPGVGLLYNELVRGVPAVFGYFIKGLPAIHSTVIFVCIKNVPVPVVPQSERFLFRRVCPKDYHLFRCVARYGYKDIRKEDHYLFEQLLLQSLEIFIQKEGQEYALEAEDFGRQSDDDNDFFPSMDPSSRPTSDSLKAPLMSETKIQQKASHYCIKGEIYRSNLFPELPTSTVSYIRYDSLSTNQTTALELFLLHEAKEAGVVYLLAHPDVRAKKESWFLKKLAINYCYAFLARNCRATVEALSVPHTNLLQVGMTYMV